MGRLKSQRTVWSGTQTPRGKQNPLRAFECFELPILTGISRKSMINRVIDTTPQEALNGTTVLNTLALLGGADILRVHDTRQAMEAIKLVEYYRAASQQ